MILEKWIHDWKKVISHLTYWNEAGSTSTISESDVWLGPILINSRICFLSGLALYSLCGLVRHQILAAERVPRSRIEFLLSPMLCPMLGCLRRFSRRCATFLCFVSGAQAVEE